MKSSQIILTLLIGCALFTLSHSRLYQALSIFRHGARYHLNSFYDGNSTYNQWGQLTPVGMRQHQNLGKALRQDYGDFFSANYNQSQVQVYTTSVNRTMMSALSQLYGLYPPGTGPKLIYVDRQYHLPPFNNKSDVQEQNFAFPLGHQQVVLKVDPNVLLTDCKNWDAQQQKNIDRQADTVNEMKLTYGPFLQRMGAMFNITNYGFKENSRLYDTLTVDRYLGRPWPATFNDSDYKNMGHLHDWFNHIQMSFELVQAINTPRFNKLIAQFDNRVKLPSSYARKWTFLSGHDTDLVILQQALNISTANCIEELWRKNATSALNCDSETAYAASIIIELHSDNEKDFYVKVRKNGKYMNMCDAKTDKCSYLEWKIRIKKTLMDPLAVCGAIAEDQRAGINDSDQLSHIREQKIHRKQSRSHRGTAQRKEKYVNNNE